jgi:hypothetical protein
MSTTNTLTPNEQIDLLSRIDAMSLDEMARVAEFVKAMHVDRPPAGLVSMFTLVADPDATGWASTLEAAAMFPVAQKLVNDLRAGQHRSGALNVALATVFPDRDNDDPSYGLEAGFRAGVAAAWLLMSQMQGGAR